MKVKDFFDLAIAVGRARDPRGEKGIEAYLQREKAAYDELPAAKKELFDLGRLSNPFHDTRILNGPEDAEVKTIMVGVDLEVGELLLADRLRERGTRVDLCVAHHPEGYAQANLYRVMEMQADIMAYWGIPITVAEGILDPRRQEVRRRLLSANHTRAVDAARLLGLPFLCCHTPADNCVNHFLQSKFDAARPETLAEVLAVLEEVPEYGESRRWGTGLVVLNKSLKSEGSYARVRAGQVFVDMTGGTGGSKHMFEKLAANTKVGTFVSMHISEDNLEFAKANHINVIVAGHTASDTLGLNLLLDEVLAGADVKVIECSGFRRISRRQ